MKSMNNTFSNSPTLFDHCNLSKANFFRTLLEKADLGLLDKYDIAIS